MVAHALLLSVLPIAAHAEPPCPPLPEPSSLQPSWQPAGCFGPHDVFAFSALGYLRVQSDALRCTSGAPATTLGAQPSGNPGELRRTLPPWAWAIGTAGLSLVAPVATCKVGEECSTAASVTSALAAAAGGALAALILEP